MLVWGRGLLLRQLQVMHLHKNHQLQGWQR
jgi:hypothetical protein